MHTALCNFTCVSRVWLCNMKNSIFDPAVLPCVYIIAYKSYLRRSYNATIPALMPVCPSCDNKFDSRGFKRHVAACRKKRQDIVVNIGRAVLKGLYLFKCCSYTRKY